MVYTATYYDGQISVGHVADVTLLPDYIEIYYQQTNGEGVTIRWQLQDITRNDAGPHQKAVLKYGDFPSQHLEFIDDAVKDALKTTYPGKNFAHPPYGFVYAYSVKKMLAVSALLIGVIVAMYFLLLPAIAGYIAMQVPVSYEETLGNSMYNQIIQGYTIDTAKTRLMNDFFNHLDYNTEYHTHITVVTYDEVNAFALPGGKMIVYSTIIDSMKSYDELAALLSHEFAHVQLRHSTRSIFSSMATSVIISLIFSNSNAVLNILARSADTFKKLGYSRRLEKQADIQGLHMMREHNIDCTGMVKLFGRLKNYGDKKKMNVPEYISSHPLTDVRIKYIKDEIALYPCHSTYNDTLQQLFEALKK